MRCLIFAGLTAAALLVAPIAASAGVDMTDHSPGSEEQRLIMMFMPQNGSPQGADGHGLDHAGGVPGPGVPGTGSAGGNSAGDGFAAAGLFGRDFQDIAGQPGKDHGGAAPGGTTGGNQSGSFSSVTETVSGSFSATTFAVPEPATLALLGSGLVVLGLVRRRTRH